MSESATELVRGEGNKSGERKREVEMGQGVSGRSGIVPSLLFLNYCYSGFSLVFLWC